ncbi:hypothetical protein HMPREF0591_2049 [Mycobacterium parascrofulaceum ATCC BAA-614]|jgi:uncharacterized membrane protein YidH (DUF202 family)|uniref:DUF202 domain-containing protein n=1 Tax=Mycobacterium parascrofulaceum ATCC BAA-614 TaxID=525368 RepID=D5P7A5_9MYCO|nr:MULTISPECIES: DUF202 domain-containing protein [Mycobacterium]EFG78050.1 hypothetical protein HMPREF0591_2049 [Mycobacterium parascrofulaceum ATCC BAA-614]OCB44315.1 hypothetical protein A9X02_14800 [Mycobacterium malmoense]
MSGTTADRGDQAERTTLAWTRTSFAFLANGALLMIRNLHGSVRPADLVPAGLAGAVALGTFLIAVHRQHTLQQRPLPRRLTPRHQVYVIGTAVLALIVVTSVGQLL